MIIVFIQLIIREIYVLIAKFLRAYANYCINMGGLNMYRDEHVNGRRLFDAQNNTTGLCVAVFMAVTCESTALSEMPIVLRRTSCKAIFVDYANTRPFPVY